MNNFPFVVLSFFDAQTSSEWILLEHFNKANNISLYFHVSRILRDPALIFLCRVVISACSSWRWKLSPLGARGSVIFCVTIMKIWICAKRREAARGGRRNIIYYYVRLIEKRVREAHVTQAEKNKYFNIESLLNHHRFWNCFARMRTKAELSGVCGMENCLNQSFEYSSMLEHRGETESLFGIYNSFSENSFDRFSSSICCNAPLFSVYICLFILCLNCDFYILFRFLYRLLRGGGGMKSKWNCRPFYFTKKVP